RARIAGSWWRDRDAADADASFGSGSKREARARPRRLGRHRWTCRRDRPARRGTLLAVDLLAQRSDRARAGAAGVLPVARVAWPRRPPRPAGIGARERRPARNRLGTRSRQLRGLELARDRRLARCRCDCAGAVRTLGAPRSGADAADAFLPQPDVRAHERVLAVHVLRHVRLDLPADPVLPDGAGLLTAAGRPADPAVD